MSSHDTSEDDRDTEKEKEKEARRRREGEKEAHTQGAMGQDPKRAFLPSRPARVTDDREDRQAKEHFALWPFLSFFSFLCL